jgi:hypothetical protein
VDEIVKDHVVILPSFSVNACRASLNGEQSTHGIF